MHACHTAIYRNNSVLLACGSVMHSWPVKLLQCMTTYAGGLHAVLLLLGKPALCRALGGHQAPCAQLISKCCMAGIACVSPAHAMHCMVRTW